MRKHFFVIAVAMILALAVTPMAQAQQDQQAEPEQQTVAGDLKAVDLENSTIVIVEAGEEPEGGEEVTLQITEETVVVDANGEETSLDALSGKEGAELSARYVAMEQGNVAVSIQIVAS